MLGCARLFELAFIALRASGRFRVTKATWPGRRSSFTGAWVSLLVKLMLLIAYLHCERDVSEPSARGGQKHVLLSRGQCSSYFARANANRGIGFVDHLTHCQKTVDLALEANVRDAVSRFGWE